MDVVRLWLTRWRAAPMVSWGVFTALSALVVTDAEPWNEGVRIAGKLVFGLLVLNYAANWLGRKFAKRLGPDALADKRRPAVVIWWAGWALPLFLHLFLPFLGMLVGVAIYAAPVAVIVVKKLPGRGWVWLPGAAYLTWLIFLGGSLLLVAATSR